MKLQQKKDKNTPHGERQQEQNKLAQVRFIPPRIMKTLQKNKPHNNTRTNIKIKITNADSRQPASRFKRQVLILMLRKMLWSWWLLKKAEPENTYRETVCVYVCVVNTSPPTDTAVCPSSVWGVGVWQSVAMADWAPPLISLHSWAALPQSNLCLTHTRTHTHTLSS